MRKIFVALGIVIILIFTAAMALPRLIDVNRYRPEIEANLEQRLGRAVSLGRMSLSLYPLAVRVENATIAEDPDFDTQKPFAEVASLFVSPRLLPLLHREIQIDRLEFRDSNLEFVRNEKGIWNFESLAAGKDGKPGSFSLGRLKIVDGRVGITDLRESKPRLQYDHIDLVLDDFAPGKAFSIEARAHMPGSGRIVLKGKAGPMDSDDGFARTPFDGDLTLTGVSLSGFQSFIKTDALANSEAVMTGSANVTNEKGMIASRGKFEARDARLRGVDVGYPISIDYDISSNVDDGTVHIDQARLQLGQTPLSVTGNVDTTPAQAAIDLKVQSLDASIHEIARLAAAFGVAFDAKTDVSGKLDLDVHAKGPANKPALSGRVAARDIRVSGGGLREPVHADAIELILTPDAVRSNSFSAKTGRTTVTSQFSLANYSSSDPQLQLKLNTANSEAGELLRIGQAYGVPAVRGISGSGEVTLNVEATGPVKHTDKLLLTGNGALRNASFNLPSMTKALQVKNADIRFNANSAVLENLELALGQTVARGRLTAHNFAAPRLEFSLAANQADVQELETIFNIREQTPARGNLLRDAGESREDHATQGSLLMRGSGSGQLSVDRVIYDQVTLKNLHASVSVDRGVITMKPITAGVYNGQQTGAIVVNARVRPATYTVDSKLQNVDANQFLSSISPIKEMLYGLLSANADIGFTTTAGSTNIVRSLNGRASLNLKDGKIAHMDFLHSLATIGKFQRTAEAVKPFTSLIQLTGDFDIQNGVASTDNLKAVIPEGSLAANGNIDLVRQILNLRVTAVLSQQYSESVGGTNIAGWMNTALANRNGELVIPVIVTGNLRNPQFAPDIQKIAQMKLENLVPNLTNPADLKNRILGDVLREKPQAATPEDRETQEQQRPRPQEQQKPGDALLDIFEKLLKGRTEKQPSNP